MYKTFAEYEAEIARLKIETKIAWAVVVILCALYFMILRK